MGDSSSIGLAVAIAWMGLVLAPSAIIAPAVAQTTWIVDDDAPGDPGPADNTVSDPLEDGTVLHPYDRIQEAINVSSDGDTVEVAPGTYHEVIVNELCPTQPCNVNGDLSITIRGTGGAAVTTIDATSLEMAAVTIGGESEVATIEGFTITGAFNDFNHQGGGVRICGDGLVTVCDCVITDNVVPPAGGSNQGGGIWVACDGNALIEGCLIADNTSDSFGVAISCVNANSIEIRDCEIRGNRHSNMNPGGHQAIFLQNNGRSVPVMNVRIVNTTITGNDGGGIFLDDEVDLHVVNCEVLSSGGIGPTIQIYANETTPARFENCLIADNQALRGAGVLVNRGGHAVLTNCTITGNNSYGLVPGIEGTGVYVRDEVAPGASATLVNCIVAGNMPTGTELHSESPGAGTTITATHCIIEGGPAYAADLAGGWPGTGNVDAVPKFRDEIGPDGIFGTGDEDRGLFPTSAGIDAGDNGAVPIDDADADDDGDTAELLPVDVSGAARLADDPNTPDTGTGTAPIVDDGAYEFAPTAPAAPGLRVWTNPSGGDLATGANWLPDAPGATDEAYVDLPGASFTVTASSGTVHDRLIAGAGDVTLDLNGTTYELLGSAAHGVVVGTGGGGTAELAVSDGTLATNTARIAGGLSIAADGTLTVSERLAIAEGVLSGTGSVVGLVENVGTTAPGLAGAGALAVAGDYRQGLDPDRGACCLGDMTPAAPPEQCLVATELECLALGGAYQGGATTCVPFDSFSSFDLGNGITTYPNCRGERSTGALAIELGGALAGESDLLTVSGEARLAGALTVELVNGFEPSAGTSIDVLTAGSLAGTFDVAFLPGLPDDLIMQVAYTNVAPLVGSPSVSLVVGTFDDSLGFNAPDAFATSEPPAGVGVGDFDGVSGEDLAIAVPAGDGVTPGTILLLRSDGTGPMGEILFLAPVFTTVGVAPSGVAVGQLNADAHLDLAVANTADDTVSILHNNGLGDGTFTVSQTVGVGDAPGDIEALHYNGDAFLDLVVANTGDGTVNILLNNGSGSFSIALVGNPIVIGDIPLDVEPADRDNRKDGFEEFGVLTPSGGLIIFGNEDGNPAPLIADVIPVGADPVKLMVADFDGDGFDDLAVTNSGDGTISLIMNTTTGGYDSALTLPVGGNLDSGVATDADGDGDIDIAVLSDDAGASSVKLVRNDLNDGTQLVFASAETFAAGNDAQILAAGDLSGNGESDLVALNGTPSGSSSATEGGVAGPPAGEINVLLNTPPPPCDGDTDASGLVDIDDIVNVVLDFGTNGSTNGGDVDGSGLVDIDDIVVVVLNFGPCV